MGIQTVTEYKKDASLELKKVKDFLIPRHNLNRYFEVYTDTPSTVLYDVEYHVSIPRLYSAHPEYPGAICKKIRTSQGDDDQTYIFEVTCEYDDDFDGADKNQPVDNNPLNRPTIIRGGFSEYEDIVVKDINGTLVRNKAKDPFEPPLTRKAGCLRFSMTKNYASLTMSLLAQYKNCINSDAWFGQAAQTVRIANISFSREIEEVQIDKDTHVTWVYWPHTFEFEVAEPSIGDGTWRRYVQNKGYRQLSGTKLIKIMDESDAHPVTTPAFLKTDGTVERNPDNVNYLAFDIYRQLPFSALNLI